MPTRQGDLALLDDPVAQRLLQSAIPARLAYNWTDGTPRAIPIHFHWNGEDLVLGTDPGAPKMKALHDGTRVALTIDSDTPPFKELLIRGTVRTDSVDGIAPEYAAMCRRVMGEEAALGWMAQLRQLSPRMARIFIRPTWVGILDYETRFPSFLERAMERAEGRKAQA